MKFNSKKVVEYWIKNAEYKWDTVKALKRSKRYSDCLFFCHLVLECLLKGLVVAKIKKTAPYIHNLIRLAEVAELELDQVQENLLKVGNSFNIRARYADYKMAFYKIATSEYTEEYFKAASKLRLWLLKRLHGQLKNM
jgi:HEPN domain-containing protein